MTELKTVKKKAKPKGFGRHLTEKEKSEALALWAAGATTQAGLAARYKKDISTFRRLFEGIPKGTSQAELNKKALEAVEAASVGDAVALAARIRETKEEHYRMSKFVATSIGKTLAKAAQENEAIGTKMQDLKALHTASMGLKVCREERFAVLGLNEERQDESKPIQDLIVKVLTAEEIKQMHTPQGDDDFPDFSDLDGTRDALELT